MVNLNFVADNNIFSRNGISDQNKNLFFCICLMCIAKNLCAKFEDKLLGKY